VQGPSMALESAHASIGQRWFLELGKQQGIVFGRKPLPTKSLVRWDVCSGCRLLSRVDGGTLCKLRGDSELSKRLRRDGQEGIGQVYGTSGQVIGQLQHKKRQGSGGWFAGVVRATIAQQTRTGDIVSDTSTELSSSLLDSLAPYVSMYDTTLRDGAQMVGISLTLGDKLKIAQLLGELGVDYIEGGWPGSNPKDAEFFVRFKDAMANAPLNAR
jgi:hypothetical protein